MHQRAGDHDGSVVIVGSAQLTYQHGAVGYVSWIGKYADKNAVLVDILYDCGAVPFVRTNVPQTMMVRIIPTIPVITQLGLDRLM